MTTISSSWFLVIISIDRWIRARFPTQSKRWCTRQHALIVMISITIVAIGGYIQFLTPLFGDENNKFFCVGNSISSDYLYFFRIIWSFLYVIVEILLPAMLMIITLIDIASRYLLPGTIFYTVDLSTVLNLFNYSSHFYIHCLTRKLFRQEYKTRLFCGRRQIAPMLTNEGNRENSLEMTITRNKTTSTMVAKNK